jgi:hypothetical protein
VHSTLILEEYPAVLRIVGGKATKLGGSSDPGTADGAGTVARFNQSFLLALGERGRLLVVEFVDGEGGRTRCG